MLKGAKLLFNESVVDCLVLNVSETGARVRTAAVVPIPDQVRLRLNDGATFSATVRWTRGVEFGFSFDGPASLPEESVQMAWRIYEAVRSTSIQEPLRLLQAAGFFGDLALQAAAEQAEAGLRHLEKELVARARASSVGYADAR